MKTCPTVEFKAGPNGTLFTNVNFARQTAENEVKETGKPVTVYVVVNGNNQPLTEIKPKETA